MIESHVSRNHGHPWDARPGFDLLEVISDEKAAIERFIEEAERKFWAVWISGYQTDAFGEIDLKKFGAVLFKPSGIREDWQDSPDAPHPGIVV
ncbi:hypothetical protein [Ferrovum sp.]|uniref:hypothetical protein n=1 Tax=Ferrovum sp. TaxID=2609467 RepID=UPI002620A8A5|nr:hypothetical protein [Ferrovum sp.]